MGPNANALLETDLIHTFVAISEVGSFTAAAKRVLRTPSAVSMQMKRLEDQLGRPLFHRHARRVSLTVDGEAFLIHSRELLRINEEALARFRVAQLEGRIRFGALDDFGSRFLPQILARFAATHPLVEVDVVLSTTAALTRQLEAGELDLVLTAADKHESLPGKTIYSEPLVWVGKRNGRAHRRVPLPLTLSAQGCPWRAAALASLEETNMRYRIAYTCETGQGQLAAVDSDLAIAPIPASLVSEDHEVLGLKQGLKQIGDYRLLLCEATRIGSAGKAFSAHVVTSFKEAAGFPP
ncbi:LysR substrate-binding domain-containing protein [Denitrobaculum tricleocarpae]|uniref:LysR family transcriptional regulator n=1 Tax=Denitrobaculum tricleocarpae TaxID=2591009 RepID=A0A545TTI0_9PROT|nr:LysR substrate-binding domain-containing protein [Denitrobaculum tricleocarpae]TQV80520.1 LysR family transcriptional regulator [Denitrobaculum tricleocarpae]